MRGWIRSMGPIHTRRHNPKRNPLTPTENPLTPALSPEAGEREKEAPRCASASPEAGERERSWIDPRAGA